MPWSNPEVALIVRAKNGQARTTACLGSIRATTYQGPAYRLAVVDDGSDPPLDCPESDAVLRHETPRGAVSATNTGLSWALSFPEVRAIAILDNDVVVPAGDLDWLARWVACLDRDPEVGAVGATSTVCNPPQQILAVPQTYTADWRGEDGKGGRKTNPAVPSLVSFGMLLRRRAVEEVGLWDEQFNPGNWEDTDYSLQLRVAGWPVKVAQSVYLHHEGHQTFGADLQSLLDTNLQKMLDKWGPGRLWDLGVLSTKQLLRLMETTW